MTHNLANDLRAEIAQGHVLVVVGSGVSIGATQGNPLASWQGFLEDGVERCVSIRGLDPKWASRVREEIHSGDMDDLLSAAEKVTGKLSSPKDGEYGRWLRETVGELELKDRTVIEAIRDLGLPLATTNYDGLIEEVTNSPPVTWRDGGKVTRLLQQQEPGILHLHGYWDEPESVVLGIRSYDRILDHGHAQAVLRALRTLKTLLFVGCGEGLSDPNFAALLEWAREAFREVEGRHYRLCRKNELAKLRVLHKEDHIVPISYGEDHGALGPFLRTLGSFSPQKAKEKEESGVALHAPRLPGPPPRCFGREDEVRDLVETLMQPTPRATPILGPPGVGKTTITLEALHTRRVRDQYGDRRYFVRCDSAKSRDALTTEIALAVGLESGSDLELRLFQELERVPVVLVLDNTETPWENDTVAVEDLLTQLSTAEGVALVASVRGDQRPLGPRWREAIRVGPFGLPAARDTFVEIAGENLRAASDLDRLLEAVDRLPIAVTLLAHQAEGDQDLSRLWNQWQEKRTALLRHADGKERLTNVEVSLELSISGPRMTSEARRLLSVFAFLPDGVAIVDPDNLMLMPGEGEQTASVLRKVGLAFDQGPRVRVLAPIREYVRRHHPPLEEDLNRAVDLYLMLARKGELVGAEGGAEAAERLVQELGNMDAMISKGLERADPEPVVRAALGLGEFVRFTGWGSQVPLERAMDVALATGRERLLAACGKKLGDIALYRSDHDAARARYEEALPLYRRVGDVLGEANCIQSLGDIALQRSDHDTARARYEECLSLFRNVGDVLGEAWSIKSLGNIALERSDHDAARARYEEALPLFRRVGSVLGEATCIQRLGDIALQLSDYNAARTHYDEALPLHRRVGDVRGEANCIQSLGDIALQLSDQDVARARYAEALPLYRRVGDVVGEANCIQRLGDIALRLSDPETAGARFTQALALYQRIREPYSIGWTHGRLARLAPEGSEERLGHLRAAREAWESIKRPDLVEEWLVSEFGEIP